MASLTDVERSVLDFERRWYARRGAKEQAIVDELDMRPSRYFQILAALLRDPRALAYDAQTVRRAQRVMELGLGPRNAERLGVRA